MSDPIPPCDYAVTTAGGQAVIRILGHADYLNCLPLKKFLDFVQESPVFDEIFVDLSCYRSIDSTALGLLARSAISLKKASGRRLLLANLHGASRRSAEQL